MEGVPLKLLVSAVLLAAVLPPAIAAFSSIREQHQMAVFESEMNTLIGTIQGVAMGGAGTTKEVDVEIPSFVEKVVFGSKNGPSCVVHVVFSGGVERIYLMSHPMVYVRGETDEVFLLVGGTTAHVVVKSIGFVDVDRDGFLDTMVSLGHQRNTNAHGR